MAYKKKSLGQHFLKNETIAQAIADSLILENPDDRVIEIGPGAGALTQHLLNRKLPNLYVVEKDDRFAEDLKTTFPELKDRVIHKDILKIDWNETFGNRYHVIGNFPYNISNLLLFKMFENRHNIQQMVGMFQREVAQRACSGNHTKSYGKLSVLLQAFYQAEYLFDVGPQEFSPPPRVHSGVIRLLRKEKDPDIESVKRFKAVVKAAFNLRRKKLSNSLKQFTFVTNETVNDLLTKRPEHLDYNDFIFLSHHIETG